jgi:FlaA1/EpsC-like NDP-sugar epimerase/lipopolysaccharide/colanic/teichoic acid biosynthesis glycosyltransferase
MKRAVDLAAAGLGLLLLSPVLLIVALAVRLEGRGPVLIRRSRLGRGFRPFHCYFFRTSSKEDPCDELLPVLSGGGAPTLVGRLLRRTDLYKLPQLINVLRGEMSLVGPAPEHPRFATAYGSHFDELLRIKPGIFALTDLSWNADDASLERNREPEKEYLYRILPKRIELAREYARKASLRLDLVIACRCIWSVLQSCSSIVVLEIADGLLRRALPYRRLVVVLVQLLLIAAAHFVALLIRFEGEIPAEHAALFWKVLPLAVVCRVLLFQPLGLFSGLWRYVSVKDLRNIVASVTLSSVLLFVLVHHLLGITSYPRSVFVIDWLVLIFLLSAIRLSKRILMSLAGRAEGETRILIIGAGDAGEMLLREIEMHPGSAYRVMGFIDDDPAKKGTMVRGTRVLGSRKDLPRILETVRPDEIVIAISSAPAEILQEIVKSCRQFGLPVKCLPGLRDLLTTRGILETIRDIEPEDLLCRPAVALSSPELHSFYRGRRVMVTGAGGSIGSELVRQIAGLEPGRLVLFERHEHSLYLIERELRRLHPGCPIVPIIGDILDVPRLSRTLAENRPALLFHAAAYKHVPMMELNPEEAVKGNVLGTKNAARLALKHGVERFVFVSSDKAVKPSSVMGATKRVGELLIQDLATANGTRFLAVRFGNVLESSGSVIPLFKEQIKRGGPLTITHPQVTRYFMTTAEAVNLVLNAALLGKGGEIFVLDMGKPIRVLDMAHQLLSLYGYKPVRDIDIVYTGLRPGEKLHEQLHDANEELRPTQHPKIFTVLNRRPERLQFYPELLPDLDGILLDGQGAGELKERLAALVEGGMPRAQGVLNEPCL